MTCCGNNRQAAGRQTRQASSSQPGSRETRLHYVGDRPVTVEGPATGRLYEFNGVIRTRWVDTADVVGITNTGLFRLI